MRSSTPSLLVKAVVFTATVAAGIVPAMILRPRD
jgi:hypothetical protein